MTIKSFFNRPAILVTVACLVYLNSGWAQVKLPRLISDGMVLQRDKPIKIWGWAAPNEKVAVQFNGKNYSATANNDRHWQLQLAAMQAGGPYEMTIAGSNKIVIKDIMLGDVWVCSGQSNMEFTVSRAKDKYASQIANATNTYIRQFFVNRTFNFKEQDDIKSSGWKAADPQTVLQFTAVGYFFACQLYEKYHIPIGLISSSVGGTPAEAWTSADGFKELPAYLDQVKPYYDSTKINEIVKHDKLLTTNWYNKVQTSDTGFLKAPNLWKTGEVDSPAWKTLNIPGTTNSADLKGFNGIIWLKKDIYVPADLAGKDATLQLGTFSDQDTTYFNGQKIGYTPSRYLPRKYAITGNLIKAGKNTIVMRILVSSSAVSFYQGKPYSIALGATSIPLTGQWQYLVGFKTDPYPSAQLTNFSYIPTSLYNAMIAPLINYQIKGVIWYQGEANTTKAYAYRPLFKALINDWRKQWHSGDFPFLFVQLANLRAKPKEPAESTWAELREAQAMALSLPNTGMAVTHDIGEWNDIHPLDKLDVGKRLALAASKIAYDDKRIVYSGPTYQSIKISGNKCIVQFANIGSGLVVKDNGTPAMFAIAGPDRKFVWADARIDGDKVIVWSDKVNNPVAVRYAWADNPEDANLYNKEGLPAVSFRTDDWPGLTFGK